MEPVPPLVDAEVSQLSSRAGSPCAPRLEARDGGGAAVLGAPHHDRLKGPGPWCCGGAVVGTLKGVAEVDH